MLPLPVGEIGGVAPTDQEVTMSHPAINHVFIIGAGTMGRQIGWQCALHGVQVTLYDILPAVLAEAEAQIHAYGEEMAAAGRVTAAEVAAARTRITTSTDPAGATAADLLIESVPENPALKQDIFRLFASLCPPHTLFTTNTSSLVPSMLAEATGRPGQFAALHFHQPVWHSNLVDIMPHPGTNPETVAVLEQFARRIGQIPLVLQKENHGYVFNAMYNALNREAITLSANGVAAVEDIDRAWMVVMKMPIGPLGLLDVIGLDTAWHITVYWANILGDPQLQTNATFLKTYVDQGWLGRKAGRGFYTYPDPAYARPGFLEGEIADSGDK
jgi:3-hydroxybutyryl-CoA dehydrogenase